MEMRCGDSRILPALVVHEVVVRTLLVIRIYGLRIEDLCFVEQVAMKTEDFLILRERRGRRHVGSEFARETMCKRAEHTNFAQLFLRDVLIKH